LLQGSDLLGSPISFEAAIEGCRSHWQERDPLKNGRRMTAEVQMRVKDVVERSRKVLRAQFEPDGVRLHCKKESVQFSRSEVAAVSDALFPEYVRVYTFVLTDDRVVTVTFYDTFDPLQMDPSELSGE
jgi:hypothetical protein